MIGSYYGTGLLPYPALNASRLYIVTNAKGHIL
jgi:hypothetical protein